MNDSKVDGAIYVKQEDNKYYRRSLPEHGQRFLIKESMAAMKAVSGDDILLLKMGYYLGIELQGYVDPGDKETIFYSFIETASSPNDDGYVVAISGGYLVASIVMAYPEIWGCGISSLIPSHETRMQYAVDYCKNNAQDLHLSARDYVCSLNISWCLPPDYYSKVRQDANYNPADIHQGTSVGRSFNVIGCPGAIIRGNLWLDRCREMEVSNVRLYGHHITTGCERIKFKKVICVNLEGTMTCYSNDPTDSMLYPTKYFLDFKSLSPGGSYWIDYDNCHYKRGFVLGGNKTAAYNVIKFENCLFEGAVAKPANPDCLNTRAAGLYIDMMEGHTDGITLINCDLSYNGKRYQGVVEQIGFPLWNNTSTNAVTMIGCYYEACGYDFITSDGISPSPDATIILNGHDYDRHYSGNTRIGLRATRWALHCSRTNGDQYAKIIIPEEGGAVSIEDQNTQTLIGAIVNRIGSDGYGSTITYQGNSLEFNDQRASFLMGGRTFRNWNKVGTVQRFSIDGQSGKNITFTATNPSYAGEITGNVLIKLTLVGGTIGATAYPPINFEGYCTVKSGSGNLPWSDISLTSGALENDGFLCTVTGITKTEIRFTFNHKLTGLFSGTVYCECIADVAELDSHGNAVNWAVYNY